MARHYLFDAAGHIWHLFLDLASARAAFDDAYSNSNLFRLRLLFPFPR